MKIRTPHYYQQFQCIAGACTDTCCAGWEVDVDRDSYQYYKAVKGEFGKRLKSVMVPSGDGGCTFTLKNGRCPFLNDENLCDLYTALGEDRLCGTCAEFPRFINEYGNVREIGIAPSCKTAGELIFNCKDSVSFVLEDDGKPITGYNEIDGLLYMQLRQARETAYEIIQNPALKTDAGCLLLLEYAARIQKKMNQKKVEGIETIVHAFADMEYLQRLLERAEETYTNKNTTQQEEICDLIDRYFERFPGMEVIHPDWLAYLELQHTFLEKCRKMGGDNYYRQRRHAFDEYYADRDYEYRSLLVYYVYRYFLDAVYDGNVLLKVKNALVGYLILKHLNVAAWDWNNGVLTKTEQIDIAHLYSRQFEHSYVNFETYTELFCRKRCYSKAALDRLLLL